LIDKDYIFSLITEMAEQDGLTPRDFIENLYAEKTYSDYGELPDEAKTELSEARKQKTGNRYTCLEQDTINTDISEFARLFPDVSTDSIPKAVWDAVADGNTLTAAYAIYTIENGRTNDRASAVNELNNTKSAFIPIEGNGEETLSEKQVENMKPAEIKKNYKKILKSLKNWKN